MEDKKFEILSNKLDSLIRIMALQSTNQISDEKEKIKFLYFYAGISNKEISLMLGKTENSINIAISRLKKEINKNE